MDRTRSSRNILILLAATNVLTLFGLVYVYLNQPPVDPTHESMVEMIEAQDWLLGKMSEELWQTNAELIKLQFDQIQPDPSDELKDLRESLTAYEKQRQELGLDLDQSRKELEHSQSNHSAC